MAQVDFTLDDIKSLFSSELDRRFVAERSVTRQIIREEVQAEVSSQFRAFIEYTFQPFVDHVDGRFESLESHMGRVEREMQGVKRVVRQHSADIAELRAGH
mgnify:CR=1 FL=1